jgi:hypothetical protein
LALGSGIDGEELTGITHLDLRAAPFEPLAQRDKECSERPRSGSRARKI